MVSKKDDMGNPTLPYAGPKTPRSKHWKLYLMLTIGVIAGVLLREPIVEFFWAKPTNPAPAKIQLPKNAQQFVEPSLKWADDQSLKAVDDHLASLSAYFEEIKKQTPAFAEEILGWRSKWYIGVDHLPFTRTDRHETYLRERFAAHIFTSEQLSQSIEAVVKHYIASVQSTEGRMLVDIKADIAGLPQASLPQFASKESLERAFATALENAAKKVQVDLRKDAIREIASAIAGDVLGMVALRLGLSAGILAAGAASSWVTLGVGLAVAIIVDYVVGKIWDWWADPVGDMSRMLNEKLDEIHKLIVDGDGTNPGLRGKLLELHEKRKQVRRQAIGDLIEGKVQP
ncbi:MAG: hypothetical protein IT448_01745 [Phycisphaerales bacterium]|nr:hypothetical protein [Phycisphaerales bacterium]